MPWSLPIAATSTAQSWIGSSPRSTRCHGWSVSSAYEPISSSRLPPPAAASGPHGDEVMTPAKSNSTVVMGPGGTTAVILGTGW